MSAPIRTLVRCVPNSPRGSPIASLHLACEPTGGKLTLQLFRIDGHHVPPVGVLPVLRLHVGAYRSDLEAVLAGVSDHVLHEYQCGSGAAQAVRRARVVGTDRRWAALAECQLRLALDILDRCNVAAALCTELLADRDSCHRTSLDLGWVRRAVEVEHQHLRL